MLLVLRSVCIFVLIIRFSGMHQDRCSQTMMVSLYLFSIVHHWRGHFLSFFVLFLTPQNLNFLLGIDVEMLKAHLFLLV